MDTKNVKSSTEDHQELPPETVNSLPQETNFRPAQIPREFRSQDISYHRYEETSKRSSFLNPRPCRPPIIPFDTEKYADIFIRLENLKNLDTEELPKPGEFVVRVMCMGQLYGHFPSGSVNLHSLAYYARSEEVHRRTCPDIFLEHDISFCIKFKDLVDNPLVFHLCHAGGLLDSEAYAALPPLGFICLDMGRILNYQEGNMSDHIETWFIPEKQPNLTKLPFLLNGMTPLLQLSVACAGGLPDAKQLLQGNLMTVFCESLHNLPAIVQQNVSYPDNQADVQLYLNLPHSQTEPILKFPGGKYRENYPVEPVFKRGSQSDEATQTRPSMAELKRSSAAQLQEVSSKTINSGIREPRHWASVKENSPDTPLEATTMTGDTIFEPVETGGDGEMEIFGDGREDFMEFSETGEPRIVWNSLHRKYLSVEAYRGMLTRLSQNAIWPLEIAVAVKKKTDRPKKKKEIGAGNKSAFPSTTAVVETNPLSNTSSNDSNDRMIMAELGQRSSSTTADYTLIFHGLAFVDLSCLVYPGLKSARFSCRVHPFSSDLLQRRTCAKESVLPEILLLSLVQKSSGENTKSASNKKVVTQNMGANVTSTRSVRQSQASNPPDTLTTQQDIPMKPRASLVRKSDFPFDVSKKQHTEDPAGGDSGGGQVVERNPFVVVRISMLRSIVPCYKSTEISKMVDEYLPKRELTRRRLVNAGSVQQKYRRAILEAAAEISHEFSQHYWKDVLQNGQEDADHSSSNSTSNETLKTGFLFYLNASGRYLVLREHLRTAISNVVQQKCLNLRPSGFHNHRDFQSYLHDMYVYLVDEMNEVLTSTTLQETDPLKSNLDRLLQQTNCAREEELSKINLHARQITDMGYFAEESFAQGDFETCHKLHLQRICRDKESSRCWTEFAIMWLARGDDRMAEIAVREALRKDPLHLYALLISGMISVRHGDERGLECLGAALGLLPMAPEILAIVGIANSLIGNDIAADYFFRKAAYVHRTITGQPTDDIEKMFTMNNAKRPFNMKQFALDMDLGLSHLPESTKKHVQVDSTQQEQQQQQQPPQLAAGTIAKKLGRRSKQALSHIKSMADGNSVVDKKVDTTSRRSLGEDEAVIGRKQSKEQRRISKDVNNNSKTISDEAGQVTQTLFAEAVVGPTSTQPTSNGPKFSFTENLSDILPEEVNLSPLSPSIQSPYNITEFSEKLEKHLLTIDYLEKTGGAAKLSVNNTKQMQESDPKMKNSKLNVYIPKDDGIAPDNLIKEEYDKIINANDNGSTNSGSQSGTFHSSNDVISTSSKTRRSIKRLSEDKKTKEEPPPSGKNNSDGTPPPVSLTPAPVQEQGEKKSEQPKLTDRLGSELIWAANLLINLRLFDFLDGVLAKHLYFYGKRSVQFIYLRALSLHLRQRDEQALPLIKEAIEFDNTNGMFYALEGHCYYVLGNAQGAVSSYEKALRIPHTNENRHLLYLRYGSLVLDQGKSKIAKRVFLHGVSKYPTPYMWLALGSACFQRQEYDQAESAFAEANRLDNTNPIAWGHLALSSLMQDKKALAEQSYKWAMRFGLKKGVLLDEIQRLQRERGFGDPSFPRIPNCMPHDYYLRRMGKLKPFNLYKEALNQDRPRMSKDRYEDTENEIMLKKKLDLMANSNRVNDMEEWDEEEDEFEEEAGLSPPTGEEVSYHPTQSTGFKINSSPHSQVRSAPPDITGTVRTAGTITTIKSPPPMGLAADSTSYNNNNNASPSSYTINN